MGEVLGVTHLYFAKVLAMENFCLQLPHAYTLEGSEHKIGVNAPGSMLCCSNALPPRKWRSDPGLELKQP